ncbi:hypothetical protein [Rheinheimera sp. NSM]
MLLSPGWLLIIYLSPVLSIIPVMLLWQGIAPVAALWQKVRLPA